jgi:hypothetical protein
METMNTNINELLNKVNKFENRGYTTRSQIVSFFTIFVEITYVLDTSFRMQLCLKRYNVLIP